MDKKKRGVRFLATLLSLTLVFSLMGVPAFASEGGSFGNEGEAPGQDASIAAPAGDDEGEASGQDASMGDGEDEAPSQDASVSDDEGEEPGQDAPNAARAKASDDILWYYAVYVQMADGSYPDDPVIYGQGGWSKPDAPISISHEKYDGRVAAQLELGKDVIYDPDCEKERLSANAASEADRHNPLRIYYKRPFTVTYQYEGEIPQNAPALPGVRYTYAGEQVTVASTPSVEGYTFTGWSAKSPEGLTIQDGKMVAPNSNVVLLGTWKDNKPPVGDLTISKTVTGEGAELDRDFNFKATLSDAAVNGVYGDLEFVNGVASFTLRHGESKTAKGLPAGVDYLVEEEQAAGYTVTKSGESGSIARDALATAEFENSKNAVIPVVGDLTISTTVTGEGGELDRDFNFKVTLSDDAVNGVYGDLEFVNGVASFTLRHGESKTAKGLPAGVDYLVEEEQAAGYTVTKSGESGSIARDALATAEFEIRKDAVIPGGGSSDGDGSSQGGKEPQKEESSTPSVEKKPVAPHADDLAKTGDNATPLMVLALSGVVLAAMLVAYFARTKGVRRDK